MPIKREYTKYQIIDLNLKRINDLLKDLPPTLHSEVEMHYYEGVIQILIGHPPVEKTTIKKLWFGRTKTVVEIEFGTIAEINLKTNGTSQPVLTNGTIDSVLIHGTEMENILLVNFLSKLSEKWYDSTGKQGPVEITYIQKIYD